MKRIILGLIVLLLPALVHGQTYSTNIQRIGRADSQPISAASPLPITGTVTVGASTQLPAALGPQAPAGSLSVTPDTTGQWTVDVGTYGAGNVDASTPRTVEAADSAMSAATIQQALTVANPANPIPSRGTMIAGNDGGTVRLLHTDASGDLQVDVGVGDLSTINGVTPAVNQGNATNGTLRVSEASCSNVEYYQGALGPGPGPETTIPARAGRCRLICQNQDADGELRVNPNVSTANSTKGILLNRAVLAGQGGGSLELEQFGGALWLGVATAAATISYQCWEVY